MSTDTKDWGDITEAALRAVDGGAADRERFWRAIAPVVQQWLTQVRYFDRTGQREDHLQDGQTRVWEALLADECARLRSFFESDKTRALMARDGAPERARYFRNWLHLTVKHRAHDQLRGIREYRESGARPGQADGTQHRWLVIEEMTTGKMVITNGAERKLFIERILTVLEQGFTELERRAVELWRSDTSMSDIAVSLELSGAEQAEKVLAQANKHRMYRPALELWCASYPSEEIARVLALDSADDATRLVNAAKAYLRRNFASSAPPGRPEPG